MPAVQASKRAHPPVTRASGPRPAVRAGSCRSSQNTPYQQGPEGSIVVISRSSTVVVRMSSLTVFPPFCLVTHTGQDHMIPCRTRPDQQGHTGSMVVMSASSAVIVRMSSAMVFPPFCLAHSRQAGQAGFLGPRLWA